MYSYNNIIEKGAPEHIDVIDHCLDSFVEIPPARQRTVADGVDCIVVDNFLSDDECDAIRNACEKVGYTFWHQKEHKVAESETNVEDTENVNAVRIVDTIEAEFPELSQKLYKRISSVVDLTPKCFDANMPNADEMYERDLHGAWEPCALSRNLLLGRYGPGGHFMPHIDGSTIVDLNTKSFYTLLIYLNDCVDGGETRMFSGEQCRVMMYDINSKTYRGGDMYVVGSVQPKKGSAVFFYYDLLHEAAPVMSGLKYICRADLLYRRIPPILTEEKDVKAFKLYQQARLTESNGDAFEACKMFQKIAKLSPGVAALYQLDEAYNNYKG